jgi:CheY-like chemotaxis protein
MNSKTFDSMPLPQPPAREEAPVPIDVLLVDDSPVTRRAQRRMLAITGIPTGTVVEAADGLEALDALRRHAFDVVLCDLHMPRMGGVAVLAAIRKDPDLHRPVIVFVSSDHSEERRARVLEAGAAAFVHKPLDPEKLRSVLHAVLPALGAS